MSVVAASYAPGVAGKAGEDPEIDKASRGLYKVGAAARQRQQLVGPGRGVDQLSSPTFLVPIVANALATTNSVDRPDVVDDRPVEIVESDCDGNATTVTIADGNELSYSTSLVISHQYSRSSVTYVPQPESGLAYDYQLSINGTEDKRKSYRVVEKIAESGQQTDQATKDKAKRLSTAPGSADTRGGRQAGGRGRLDEGNIRPAKLAGRLAEPIARGWSKSATRAIPGLNRIVHADGKPIAVASEHGNDNHLDKLSGGSYSVRGSTIADRRSSVAIGSSEELGRSGELAEVAGKPEAGQPAERKQKSLLARDKHRPKPGTLLHAMFAGYNEPDNVVDDTDASGEREREPAVASPDENDRTDEPDVESPRGERRPHRSDPARSAEDVKLEEAHLSAPLRAKLVSDDGTMIVSGRKTIGRVQTATRPLPSRRRTTEDRGTPPARGVLREDSIDNGSRVERMRQMPRILMRHARKSLDSRDSGNDENDAKKIFKREDTVKLESFEKNRRKSGMKMVSGVKRVSEANASSDTSSTETGDEGSSPPSPSRRIVSVGIDEYKPENIESKDFVSEERDINEIDVDSDEDDDEEIDEEDEEEDLEDSPILDEDINDKMIDNRCGIKNVSPESMRVLEQFESAILDADSGDITANP